MIGSVKFKRKYKERKQERKKNSYHFFSFLLSTFHESNTNLEEEISEKFKEKNFQNLKRYLIDDSLKNI